MSVGRAFKIGGSLIAPPEPGQEPGQELQPAFPKDGLQAEDGISVAPAVTGTMSQPVMQSSVPPGRTVRFPDEATPDPNQQPSEV